MPTDDPIQRHIAELREELLNVEHNVVRIRAALTALAGIDTKDEVEAREASTSSEDREGMTLADYAMPFVRKHGHPMSPTQIATLMVHRGFKYSGDVRALSKSLNPSIRRKADRGKDWTGVGQGMYGLLEWSPNGKRPTADKVTAGG